MTAMIGFKHRDGVSDADAVESNVKVFDEVDVADEVPSLVMESDDVFLVVADAVELKPQDEDVVSDVDVDCDTDVALSS